MTIRRLLVANRGEIAVRVQRAAADLGVPTVAVTAADDPAAAHLRHAERAVTLHGRGAAAFLDVDDIVAAAVGSGCDALLPGYGFRSESDALAQACAKAGMTFVGPTPDQLRLLGDKTEARALAERCGVPILPGTRYDELLERGMRKTDGMTLFLTDMDPDHVEIHPIRKMGRNAVPSNEVFIDNLRVPAAHRIGEEGAGLRYLFDSLNPERMLVSAEALGLGRAAPRRAVRYSKEREVFDRPIGMNQAIQFPLADSLARLDAAELTLRKATWLFDRGKPCGREANTAKYLCADAGFEAADRALQTHGGMGYAEEFHVARYFREARLLKIAPLTQEMVLNYLGTHVLGLPRSY